jgi:hypothetical protein
MHSWPSREVRRTIMWCLRCCLKGFEASRFPWHLGPKGGLPKFSKISFGYGVVSRRTRMFDSIWNSSAFSLWRFSIPLLELAVFNVGIHNCFCPPMRFRSLAVSPLPYRTVNFTYMYLFNDYSWSWDFLLLFVYNLDYCF